MKVNPVRSKRRLKAARPIRRRMATRRTRVELSPSPRRRPKGGPLTPKRQSLRRSRTRKKRKHMAAQESVARSRTDEQHVAAVKNFETAVNLFQKQSFARAKEIFEKLADGSVLEVASRARVYLRMCEQRLGRMQVEPRTALDFYYLQITHLNP